MAISLEFWLYTSHILTSYCIHRTASNPYTSFSLNTMGCLLLKLRTHSCSVRHQKLSSNKKLKRIESIHTCHVNRDTQLHILMKHIWIKIVIKWFNWMCVHMLWLGQDVHAFQFIYGKIDGTLQLCKPDSNLDDGKINRMPKENISQTYP